MAGGCEVIAMPGKKVFGRRVAEMAPPALKEGVQMTCPYCGRVMILANASRIYGTGFSYSSKKMYVCAGYPVCDSYIAVQQDSNYPQGTPANGTLRRMRMAVHAEFDPLWKAGPAKAMKRYEAYAWLAAEMGIPVNKCHMSLFDEQSCEKALGILHKRKTLRAQIGGIRDGNEIGNTEKACTETGTENDA